MVAVCSGEPFAGHNATKTRFHAAQVEGGGIKVCDGVLGEHLFDARVTGLHRRNTLVDYPGHCVTGGAKDVLFLVNDIWPAL